MSTNITHNTSLKKFNTFGIDAKSKAFVSISSIEELKTVLTEQTDQEIFILGGGSNMLLTKDLDKLVIHINLKGKQNIKEDDNHVWN